MKNKMKIFLYNRGKI